jgi:hypothetical protein
MDQPSCMWYTVPLGGQFGVVSDLTYLPSCPSVLCLGSQIRQFSLRWSTQTSPVSSLQYLFYRSGIYIWRMYSYPSISIIPTGDGWEPPDSPCNSHSPYLACPLALWHICSYPVRIPWQNLTHQSHILPTFLPVSLCSPEDRYVREACVQDHSPIQNTWTLRSQHLGDVAFSLLIYQSTLHGS